jgi:hypothetical protein
MDKTIDVEVDILGKVLEGEGKIHSTLEEKDYERVAEGLKQSVAEVEEPDCPACIDGRCVRCQKNGEAGRNRPKKAGAGIGSFAAVGMSDNLFLESLEDTTENADDVYELVDDLQANLGNKISAHEDCGAAKGLTTHVRAVAALKKDGPTVGLVKQLMKREAPDQDAGALVQKPMDLATSFADILEARGWDGKGYIKHAAQKNPEGVEELYTKDDGLGGHAEQFVAVIDGPVDEDGRPLHTIDKDKLKELTGLEAFIVNLNEMRRDADKLGKTERQKAQIMAASLMYLLGGVYYKLGDESLPLFVVRVD